MTESRTLANMFDPRRNSLNAIRLGLAVAVIVSHVWPYGGYGADPGQGPDASNLGAWAVAGFFAISGWLITASRLHARTLVDYFWRRFLRIYPAFLVAIILTAFVFSPLGVLLAPGDTWTLPAAAHFVVQALPLFFFQYAPEGTLQSVPAPGLWVGTLWTLSFEFACYIAIGLLATVFKRERLLLAAVALWFVVATGWTLMHEIHSTYEAGITTRFMRLSAYFAAGALLYLLRGKVPYSHRLGAVAAVAIVGLILTGHFTLLAGIPIAYLMLYLAIALPLAKIGSRNDISYGLYIYGSPVLQFLVLIFGSATLPVAVFACLAVVCTVPFAWGSWLAVERPAMKLKRLTAGARPDREGHVPTPVVPADTRQL